MATLLTTCCFLFNATATRADESTPKIVASVVCPSVDSVFTGAGRIANAMKCDGLAEGARFLATSRGCFDVLDESRPFGYVLATDDNTVFPFFFFPVKDVEKNNEEALNASIASLVKKIANDRIPQELIPDAGFFVDDVFVVTQQEFKERAQAIPQNEYLDSIQKDSGVLLTVNVNLSALPKELIEAVSSLARQKLAESLPDDDENKLKSVEDSLANLSDLLNSIQALQYNLEVPLNPRLSPHSNALSFQTLKSPNTFRRLRTPRLAGTLSPRLPIRSSSAWKPAKNTERWDSISTI